MFREKKIDDFVTVLSGSDPVPGGGGVCALCGALGTALGNMVAALTVGKKKYADVEDEIKDFSKRAEDIREKLMGCIDRDAECFRPLSEAYGIKAETEEEKREKERIMEDALRLACTVPLEIMELSAEAIELHKDFASKGSALAVSDAGVGAVLCKSALQGASLNVWINTKLMKDRVYAEELNKKAEGLLEKYTVLADEIFSFVQNKLK